MRLQRAATHSLLPFILGRSVGGKRGIIRTFAGIIAKEMRIEQNYSLAEHNTIHLPVKTRWFMEYATEEELGRILRDEYFQECFSLHIGGGSNLLFINDFNGIILHSCIKGITCVKETEESVFLRVGAAEVWDKVVAYAVEQGWGGIENLSLIPGETGAAAVQNIGAYGVEIKDVIESVEAYNQLTFEKRVFSQEECAYGYRDSFFKDELALFPSKLFHLAGIAGNEETRHTAVEEDLDVLSERGNINLKGIFLERGKNGRDNTEHGVEFFHIIASLFDLVRSYFQYSGMRSRNWIAYLISSSAYF